MTLCYCQILFHLSNYMQLSNIFKVLNEDKMRVLSFGPLWPSLLFYIYFNKIYQFKKIISQAYKKLRSCQAVLTTNKKINKLKISNSP